MFVLVLSCIAHGIILECNSLCVLDFFRFKFFVFVLSCICVFVQAAGAGRKTRGLEFKANKQEQCQFFFALIASSVMLQTGCVEKTRSLS